MSQGVVIKSSIIQQFILERLRTQEVEENLKIFGFDEETIAAYLKEFKRIKYAKRQNTGFGLLSAGALLGFISCVLSMLNLVPELFGIFLYGFTSLAIIFILAGFYFIFE